MEVPGIGTITATAILASVADAHHFRSGRDFAANLGLIPREHSSGGKQRLYGITKRGDVYLRTLLRHGARSALRCAGEKQDRLLRWAAKLAEKRGANVAAVALANKVASRMGLAGAWPGVCSRLVKKHDQTGCLTVGM